MEATQTKIAELKTKTPRLIQRCFIHKDSVLKFEYMMSSEFDPDCQSRMLKKMLEEEITLGVQNVGVFGRNIQTFIIASGMFDFVSYVGVVEGLIRGEWVTQGPTHLNLFITRYLGARDESGFDIDTEIWFDFVNGAFFTFKKEKTQSLLDILGDKKKKWAEST